MRDSIHWRLYEKRDREALLALHVEQEAALGQFMDLPDLLDTPVLVPMVGERDGEAKGFFYLEAVPECVFVSRDPVVSASALRIAPQIFEKMRRRGFRMIRMHIPGKTWLGAESEIIGDIVKRAGFTLENEYDSYLYDLRGGKIPAVTSNRLDAAHDRDKAAQIG
jgi:hypothetical protein